LWTKTYCDKEDAKVISIGTQQHFNGRLSSCLLQETCGSRYHNSSLPHLVAVVVVVVLVLVDDEVL
jgi:hypothetical protein